MLKVKIKLWPDHTYWALAKSHLTQESCFSGRRQFAKVTCFSRKQEKDVVAAYKNLNLWGSALNPWCRRKNMYCSYSCPWSSKERSGKGMIYFLFIVCVMNICLYLLRFHSLPFTFISSWSFHWMRPQRDSKQGPLFTLANSRGGEPSVRQILLYPCCEKCSRAGDG